MSIKPILFNTEMVRAILEGRKTVTRRVVKEPYYIEDAEVSRISGLAMHRGTAITHGMPYPDSPYSPNDLLYVRETWSKLYNIRYPEGKYVYKASDSYPFGEDGYIVKFRWHPSIHMPREAARIWLRVTDVRVERLQDCGNAQAKDEGCTCCSQFARVWDSTVKPLDIEGFGWEANPWVWVVEFERWPQEVQV